MCGVVRVADGPADAAARAVAAVGKRVRPSGGVAAAVGVRGRRDCRDGSSSNSTIARSPTAPARRHVRHRGRCGVGVRVLARRSAACGRRRGRVGRLRVGVRPRRFHPEPRAPADREVPVRARRTRPRRAWIARPALRRRGTTSSRGSRTSHRPVGLGSGTPTTSPQSSRAWMDGSRCNRGWRRSSAPTTTSSSTSPSTSSRCGSPSTVRSGNVTACSNWPRGGAAATP